MDLERREHPRAPTKEADLEGDPLRGAGERVLVASSDEDAAAAERLRSGLASRGFDARTLSTPMPGERALAKEIRACDFVVVLLSSRSVPAPSAPEPGLARILRAIGSLRGHALYLIPTRLDPVEPGPLEADHLQVIDLNPDWERGQREIEQLMIANYGHWDLESRHFMILGFATLFLASALALALVVLPRIVDDARSIRSILAGGGIAIVWIYGTFLASAWIGNQLGRWARFRRVEREWAWRSFVGLWAVAVALLVFL